MEDYPRPKVEIVKLHASDLKNEETTLLYINDQLQLSSKDTSLIEGFVRGYAKAENVDDHNVMTKEYAIELSEEHHVKDSLSWLYVCSGGMQQFSNVFERLQIAQMVDVIQLSPAV